MNGAAPNPISAARRPSRSRAALMAGKRYGVACSASTTCSLATSSSDLSGLGITGPTPSRISKSTPMPWRGSMMSAKTTAASTPRMSTGRQVTSTQRSEVVASSMKEKRSRRARYSGRERPAWRMNHTGVVSNFSQRVAARKRAAPSVTACVPGVQAP